jgi:16S rRNA (cytosine967-C5)-methyltransferase
MSTSESEGARERWAPGAAPLAEAARVIARVAFEGRSFEDALAHIERSRKIRDRPATMAIARGTLRWYLRLAPAVDSLLKRPGGLARELRALLIATAHQVEYSRNVPQASVHAAVDAARILGQERSTGLVNAVLRRFVAERAALLARADRDPAVRAAHPKWLLEQLRQAWPDRVESILAGNNAHPPMVLRVDVSRTPLVAYLDELAAAGLPARALPWSTAAVVLEEPVPVGQLPGFQEGRVSVQDAGAQIAATLLDVAPGMRVLDACAAPGGKTGHILERTPNLAELVAIDVDPERVDLVQENLTRLQRKATLVVGDVRETGTVPGPHAFDRVLVDAPCSSTGVIRRHPDIKLLRRETDIPAMAANQLRILRACYGMLRPGGRLVYSTCSLIPAENELVVADFLASEPSARPVELPAEVFPPEVMARKVGMQLVPGAQAGTDGFYYACVENTTPGT